MSPEPTHSLRSAARRGASFGLFAREGLKKRRAAQRQRRAAVEAARWAAQINARAKEENALAAKREASFGPFSTEPRHSPVFRAQRFSAKTGALPAIFAAVFTLAFFAFAHRHPVHSAALGLALLVAGGCALAFRFWPAQGHRAKLSAAALLSCLAVAGCVCALADASSAGL